jgi:hypothetical protein
MRGGVKVAKERRLVVRRAVADILEHAGVDVPFPADDEGGVLPHETARQEVAVENDARFEESDEKEAMGAADSPPSVVSLAS